MVNENELSIIITGKKKVESWFSKENNDFEATKVAFVCKLASYTIAAFLDFCPKSIFGNTQFLVPRSKKSEKLKVPCRQF